MSITSHCLDLYHGCPGAGMKVEIYFEKQKINSVILNKDGRSDQALVESKDVKNILIVLIKRNLDPNKYR